MSRESTLFMELWESITDNIPAGKRYDVAVNYLRAFEDYGFDLADLREAADEDAHVSAAFNVVYDDEPDYGEEDE